MRSLAALFLIFLVCGASISRAQDNRYKKSLSMEDLSVPLVPPGSRLILQKDRDPNASNPLPDNSSSDSGATTPMIGLSLKPKQDK